MMMVGFKWFRRLIDHCFISVQENGHVRSFAELVGAALNFHKPGLIDI